MSKKKLTNNKENRFNSVEELIKSLEKYSGFSVKLEEENTREKLLDRILEIQDSLSKQVLDICSQYYYEVRQLIPDEDDNSNLECRERRTSVWHKVMELNSQNFNKTQIANILGIHRETVGRYLKLNKQEITLHHKRGLPAKLKPYENYVYKLLKKYPFLSSQQIYDQLKKAFPDMPQVCEKSVYNFVKSIREKNNLHKNITST